MTKKIISSISISVAALALSASSVFAHVVVTPNEAGLAARQDFSVGVPNEKDIPTTAVRLVIPNGLEEVTPYVKPGWKIDMKKTGDGEDAKVTEINWTGGEVANGLRDNFTFRAMTPTDPTTLVWKAYQTYSDGSVVSWDQKPADSGESETETTGPYSQTKIVNDLRSEPKISKSIYEELTPLIAPLALLIALTAIVMQMKKK